jgi:hypothetical protein
METNPTGLGAAIYVRRSVHDDRDAGGGTNRSIDAQKRECLEFAERNGLTVIETYDEGAGKSASHLTNDERPEYDRLLSEMGHVYDVLVAWSMDRLTRKGMGEVGHLLNRAEERGVRIMTLDGMDTTSDAARMMASFMSEMARSYSAALAIPTPIKTTCVAPTGTVSTLPGVTAGIHPVFSKYFIRRVRYAADDPLMEGHVAAGHHIEDDLYSVNTKVVSIPCRDPILDHYDEGLIEQVNEISPGDLLATQAFVQRNWADNAVSFTVNITPDVSRAHLAEAVQHFLPQLKGTTVFPDVSRPQSPYERIDQSTWAMAAGSETGQAMDECVTRSE